MIFLRIVNLFLLPHTLHSQTVQVRVLKLLIFFFNLSLNFKVLILTQLASRIDRNE